MLACPNMVRLVKSKNGMSSLRPMTYIHPLLFVEMALQALCSLADLFTLLQSVLL